MTFYVIQANISSLIINALLIFQLMAITGSFMTVNKPLAV